MTDSPVSSTIADQSGGDGSGDRRDTGGGEVKKEDVGASKDQPNASRCDTGEAEEIDNDLDDKFVVIDEDADSGSDAEAENGFDESATKLEKSSKAEEEKCDNSNKVREIDNEDYDEISSSEYLSDQDEGDPLSEVTEGTAAVTEGTEPKIESTEPIPEEENSGNKNCSDSTQDDVEMRPADAIEGTALKVKDAIEGTALKVKDEPPTQPGEDTIEDKNCSDSIQDDVEMSPAAAIEGAALKVKDEPPTQPGEDTIEDKNCSDSIQDDVEMSPAAAIEGAALEIHVPEPIPEEVNSGKIVNDESVSDTVVASTEVPGNGSEIASVQQTSRKRTHSGDAGDEEVKGGGKFMKVDGEEKDKPPDEAEKDVTAVEDENTSEVKSIEDSPQKVNEDSPQKATEDSPQKAKEDQEKSSNESAAAPTPPAPKAFPKNIVWVSNITRHVKAAEISALFSKYGRVIGAKILSDKCSNFFAVIRMDSNENAERCIRNLHKIKVQGRTISVTSAMPAMSNNQKSTDRDSAGKGRDPSSKKDRDSSSQRDRDSSSQKNDDAKTKDAKSESNDESSKNGREDRNKKDSKNKSDDHESCNRSLDDVKRRLKTALRDNQSMKDKLKVLSSTEEKLSNARLNAMTFEKKYLDLAIKHKEFVREWKARREEMDQLKNERADLLKKSMELENERAVFEKGKKKLEKDSLLFEEEKSRQQLKMSDIIRNFELNCINIEKDFEKWQKERDVIEKGRLLIEGHSAVLQRGFDYLKAERHRLQLIGDSLEAERINVKDYHNRVTEILEMCEKTLTATGSTDDTKQEELKSLLSRISTLLAKGHLHSPDLTLPAVNLAESLLPKDQSLETIQPLGNIFPDDELYKSNSYTSENVILINTEETLPDDQGGAKSDMSFSLSEEEEEDGSGAISPWRNEGREEKCSHTPPPPLLLQGKPVNKMPKSNVKSRLGGKTNERTLAEKASYVRSKLLSSRLKEEHDEISKLRQTYKKLQEESIGLSSPRERTRTPPPRFGTRDLRFDLKKSKEYVSGSRGPHRKKF